MRHRSSIPFVSKFLSVRRHLGKAAKPTSAFPAVPVTAPSKLCSLRQNPCISFNSCYFYRRISQPHVKILQDVRHYSVDCDKEVDEINFKFAVAREEIEAAMESKETVYFNEEAECARKAVREVVEMYDALLKKLPENQKVAIQRSMGLKIEQLKAEFQQLDE